MKSFTGPHVASRPRFAHLCGLLATPRCKKNCISNFSSQCINLKFGVKSAFLSITKSRFTAIITFFFIKSYILNPSYPNKLVQSWQTQV